MIIGSVYPAPPKLTAMAVITPDSTLTVNCASLPGVIAGPNRLMAVAVVAPGVFVYPLPPSPGRTTTLVILPVVVMVGDVNVAPTPFSLTTENVAGTSGTVPNTWLATATYELLVDSCEIVSVIKSLYISIIGAVILAGSNGSAPMKSCPVSVASPSSPGNSG